MSSRRKKSELFIMTADGSDQHSLGALNGNSYTPHWSR
jgi:Tol biopolymer transport system component